ncbi:hypothetical protein [Hymenobacter volaticus]|nr:hypothetical protein [Hymenobacter volaticus]
MKSLPLILEANNPRIGVERQYSVRILSPWAATKVRTTILLDAK